MKPTLPHLYKVSSTQWACSPSKDDKHILRCKFGDTPLQAFRCFNRDKTIVTDKAVYLWGKFVYEYPALDKALSEFTYTRI